MKRQSFIMGKRAICLIAAILMTLSCVLFTGCGKKEEQNTDGKIAITEERETGWQEAEQEPEQPAAYQGERMEEEGEVPPPAAENTPVTETFAPASTGLKQRRDTIAIVNSCAFAVRNDGTVAFCESVYSEDDTSIVSWTDIVSIDTDGDELAGLKADGTVVCTSTDLDVSEWTDIAAIEFADYKTLYGLKKDGTVVCTNPDVDVSEWTDIVAMDKTVAVKRDGTVFATSYEYGNNQMTEWTDIVAVSVAESYHTTVGLKKDGTCVSCGFTIGNERDVSEWTDIVAISAGKEHTVGLKRDGTVVACGTGSSCNVGGWTDIVAISAGNYCTLGLRRDGSVVFCGEFASDCKEAAAWKDIQVGDVLTDTNPYTVPTLDRPLEFDTGRKIIVEDDYDFPVWIRPDGTLFYDDSRNAWLGEYINEWTDLIAIEYSANLLVGVKNDGTVVSYNNNYGAKDPERTVVSDWTDIVAVCATLYGGFVGLKKDGTTVNAGYLGRKPTYVIGRSEDEFYWGDGELADWTDLVMIALGKEHVVGLKSDGTCVACENNKYGQCNVSDWTNIAVIYAQENTTYGIRRDGTVVICGEDPGWQSEVTGWTDIVALRFGGGNIVGLRKDGTVVACGNDDSLGEGRNDVADWTNIVAIEAGPIYTIGLRTDGVLMIAGYNAPNIYGIDKAQGILMP